MSTDESIRVLETDSSVGLTLKEVNQRISKYGYNEIEEIRQNRIIAFLKKFLKTSSCSNMERKYQYSEKNLSSLFAITNY